MKKQFIVVAIESPHQEYAPAPLALFVELTTSLWEMENFSVERSANFLNGDENRTINNLPPSIQKTLEDWRDSFPLQYTVYAVSSEKMKNPRAVLEDALLEKLRHICDGQPETVCPKFFISKRHQSRDWGKRFFG